MQYAQVPVLYAEVNLVCILFSLLILVKIRTHTSSDTLFRCVLVSSCILLVLDSLWGPWDYIWKPWDIGWSKALYAGYYFASGPTSYFWFLFSESVQHPMMDKRKMLLCAIPLFILLLLSLLSLKTGWFFYVDALNEYHYGPVYWLSLVLTYGYVVVAVTRAYIESARPVGFALKRKYRAVASFGIPVLIAGVLQELFPDLPIMCVGITMALFYVFFSMQEQQISVDGLTGLNNQNKFMQYLYERMARADADSRLYLVMMDMDHFKSINDAYGHVEGDNAIRAVADALKLCSQDRHHFIARYGGDEFAAVCELREGERIDDFLTSIRDEVENKSRTCPYTLSMSMGCALYVSGMSEQEFIKLADTQLYRDKRTKETDG